MRSTTGRLSDHSRAIESFLTPSRRLWITCGLLLLLFAQLTTSASVKSPTFDEPLHTARSYFVLMTGDWRMQAGHPPVVHRLIGPLFLSLPDRPPLSQSLTISDTVDHVEAARDILYAFNLPWDALIFPPRVVVMGLTLVLGAGMYRWADERDGPLGGLLALLIVTFSPNILAHGRLVTTDLALTCFFFLSVYTFQRLLTRPALDRFIVAGLILGLALGTKISAILLLPAFALFILARTIGLGRDSTDSDGWLQRLAAGTGWLVLTVCAALIVVWLAYGLEIGPWAEHWPSLPLPTYVQTLLHVQHHDTRGHPGFLMGERSGAGWRRYFPIAMAIKTPLPTLLGATGGLVWLLWGTVGTTSRHRRRRWDLLTGAVPPILFFGAATFSSLNIGYRHILPVVPFLILLTASLVDLSGRRIALTVGTLLALWLIGGTLRIHPDYLAYFNEIVGGPTAGRHYLTDSNLDWGQDLIGLKRYLADQHIEEVHLSYFGNVDPAMYGIHYKPLPSHFSLGEPVAFTPYAPPPGWYAISVSNLSGQYLVENPSVLDWFNHQTPVASIGHSINVYRVSRDEPRPSWAGICRAPGAPLEPEAFAQGVGRAGLRIAHFDCRNSWLFPGSGEVGWFVVPAVSETRGVAPPIGEWRIIYEQENYDGKLLFTIYRWESPPAPGSFERKAARVGDYLTLLGYALDEASVAAGDQIHLSTYWRVQAQPDRSLSLLAHLADQSGRAVAVGDALGISIETWKPGDLIIQEHDLAPESGTPPGSYRLQTGAYWLDEIERLPAFDAEGESLPADAIPLTTIEVKTRP